MTQEEERKIIDEMVRLFMEEDDFDIYLREMDKDKLELET